MKKAELIEKIYNLSKAITSITNYPFQISKKEISNLIEKGDINNMLYINKLDGSIFDEEPFCVGLYIKVYIKYKDNDNYICQIR